MDNIDRLERLNRLRADDKLTEDEFQQEKAALLASGEPASGVRVIWLIAAGLAVAVALGIAYFYVQGRQRDSESVQVSAAPVPAMRVPSAAATSDDRDVAPDLLATAISTDVIGNNPAYLEKLLGVPKIKNGAEIVFDVAGCTLRYGVVGSSVDSLMVDVTPTCSPRVMGMTITPRSTMGSVLARDEYGSLVASCVAECGNAADPVAYVSYPGSRATGFVGVHFVANYDQIENALPAWEAAIRDQNGIGPYDSPDDYETFNCVAAPPSDVEALLKSALIGQVWIRNEVEATTC